MQRSLPKWASFAGAIGGGGLMWAAEAQDWQWPPGVVWSVLIFSVICLVFFAVEFTRWLWHFLPENPLQRKFMGPLALIGFGMLCIIAGGVWYYVTAERTPSTEVPIAQNGPQIVSDDLSQLTVLQLKQRVTELTNRMRVFGGGSKAEQIELMMRERGLTGTEEEQTKQFWERADRAQTLQRKTEMYFNSHLRPEALALEDEIRKRIGRLSSDDRRRPIALQHGALAGVNPVLEVADYLDQLARELH